MSDTCKAARDVDVHVHVHDRAARRMTMIANVHDQTARRVTMIACHDHVSEIAGDDTVAMLTAAPRMTMLWRPRA